MDNLRNLGALPPCESKIGPGAFLLQPLMFLNKMVTWKLLFDVMVVTGMGYQKRARVGD